MGRRLSAKIWSVIQQILSSELIIIVKYADVTIRMEMQLFVVTAKKVRLGIFMVDL